MSSKYCAKCKWFAPVFFGDESVGECMIDGIIESNDDLRYGGYPICEAKSRTCNRFEQRESSYE